MSTHDDASALPFVFVDYASNPIDALANDLIALEKTQPSDLSNYTIWCDSRNVIHTIRQSILRAAKTANLDSLLFPTIVTLQDWVTQQNTPDKALISETNKQLLLVEAIRHSPGLFQTNNAWPLAKELVTLFNECTLAQVPLDDGEAELHKVLLKSYEFPTANIDNISRESEIVYRLWQAYREQIDARDWIDPIDHYSQTLVNFRCDEFNPLACKHFFTVGQHRFTAVEILFFHQLRQQHSLSLYSPKVSPTQYGTHHHPHLRLIKTASNYNHSNDRERALDIIYDRNTHTHARIQHFKESCSPELFKDWLSIYCCTSIERHVNAVCLQTKKWLLEDIKPIGIIVGDRLLARRIRAVLEEEGIKPTDLGGWTLSTTSAATSIEILLDAIEHNFKKDALLDLLSSPFLPDNNDNNVQYQHQVAQAIKLLKKHRSTPTDNIDSFISLLNTHYESECTHLITTCESVRHACERLISHKNKGEHELYKLSASLQTALEDIGIKQCLQNDAAGQQLLDTLDNNINSTRNNSIKINWKEWRQWLRDLFENNYFIPEETDARVTLCGFEHIDNFKFKAAVIAGVEETRLTNTKTQRTFFNEKVRHELHLPTSHESMAINFVRFRQLLEQCEHLLLSAETEHRGEPQELCAWVKLIELFCEHAHARSLHNDLLDELIKLRQETQHNITHFPDHSTEPPHPSVPSELIPTKISATQYQSLIDCPYQYFAKYVLSLREQDSHDDFEASDFGQLVHLSLQEFHFGEQYKTGHKFTHNHRDLLITDLSDISKHLFMRASFPSSVKEGWLQRWLSNVPAYIDWAIERGKQWQTLRGEASLEVILNDDITLYGHIDRIDSDMKQHAVVDYKTGSTKPSKKKVLNGELVQLPFYALLDKKITQAEYLTLGTQGEANTNALVSGQVLEKLKQDHLPRIENLVDKLKSHSPLPANGEDNVCRVCDFEGLCRKSHWPK